MACLTQETQTADLLSLTPATKSNIVQPARPWGRLYSTYIHLDPMDLEGESYTLGRAETCDIVVTDSKVPIHRIVAISKIHFEITREEDLVYIKDLSKNGTFLNGRLIGKGRTNILQNDDEIAIGFKGLKVFIFKVINDLDDNKYLPPNLRKKYQVSKLLGRGACGEVKLVFEKNTLRPFAVKKIVKSLSFRGKDKMNDPEKIAREIEILKSLEHPCVMGMLDIEETNDSVFLILEYMEGGELNELVQTTHPINENQAKAIFYQIVLAIQYLHSRWIIHRDIKPENILLQSSSPNTIIKISDFGLSRFLDEENDYKRTICGTPQFAAPEVLKRQMYGYQADIWSLGVVLYFMLGRELPFKKSEKVLNKDTAFAGTIWENISEDAKDLVRSMLTVDPQVRIKIDEVLEHPWIANDYGMLERVGEMLYGEHRTIAAIDSSTEGDSLTELDSENSSSPPAKRSRSE